MKIGCPFFRALPPAPGRCTGQPTSRPKSQSRISSSKAPRVLPGDKSVSPSQCRGGQGRVAAPLLDDNRLDVVGAGLRPGTKRELCKGGRRCLAPNSRCVTAETHRNRLWPADDLHNRNLVPRPASRPYTTGIWCQTRLQVLTQPEFGARRSSEALHKRSLVPYRAPGSYTTGIWCRTHDPPSSPGADRPGAPAATPTPTAVPTR